jgi:hypothetical protein
MSDDKSKDECSFITVCPLSKEQCHKSHYKLLATKQWDWTNHNLGSRGLHGPGPDTRTSARPGPRAGPEPGSTDNVRVLAGFVSGSNESYRTFRAFSAVFFRKENVIRSCAHLMLVTQSDSGNKSHRPDFLADFRSCLPETVRDNTLQTWHPI